MENEKHVRNIRCHGCREPVALLDAITWQGFYYCLDCAEELRRRAAIAARKELKEDASIYHS